MREKRAAFGRFVVVGCSIALASALAMAVLVDVLRMHEIVAAAIVALAGNAWGFVANRRWSFRATDGRAMTQFLRYTAVALAAVVASIGIFAALTGLGLHYLVASLVVSAVFAAGNFVAHFHWTFAAQPPDGPAG